MCCWAGLGWAGVAGYIGRRLVGQWDWLVPTQSVHMIRARYKLDFSNFNGLNNDCPIIFIVII